MGVPHRTLNTFQGGAMCPNLPGESFEINIMNQFYFQVVRIIMFVCWNILGVFQKGMLFLQQCDRSGGMESTALRPLFRCPGYFSPLPLPP